MKILVTGGAGYLGSMLVRKLLENKHKVIVLDTGIYGFDSLKELPVQIIRKDVREINTLQNIDVVIHLASIVGDSACDLNQNETVEINVEATKNLAELCAKNDVRLLYASTCSVYGKNPKKISSEEDKTIVPISLYGKTKLISEKVIKDSGCDYTILRLGTLFGLSYRMRFDLVVNLFVAKALSGERITVFGGNQWRPFLHVEDAADTFVWALNRNENGIFNVALENYVILGVAKIISNIFDVPIEVSSKIVDERNYRVDTKKITNRGWKAKRTIRDAAIEIQTAYRLGFWKDYKKPIYSNYKSLFDNFELMKNIYTYGPIPEVRK